MVTVCTVLQPHERSRVEAAGIGCFTTFHLESLPAALEAARRGRVDALVLSPHRCGEDELRALARFLGQFPAVPTVALVSETDPPGGEALLKLGASGVRTAVDCTRPTGLRRLRELLAGSTSPSATQILAHLLPALGDAGCAVRIFFETLARCAPVLPTARCLARHVGVRQGTLQSRFCRAGLPSPKTYLADMRLLHAAHLFLNPGLSVSAVADRLDYSSPPCFARHLRVMWGVSPVEFRRRYPFEVVLQRYVDRLITPYRETLRVFSPLPAGWWGQGPRTARVSRAG